MRVHPPVGTPSARVTRLAGRSRRCRLGRHGQAKATVEFSELRDLKEQRWGAEEARRVLAAGQRSGLSLNAFAREHGFTGQRLGWCKQRIDGGGGEELARFVPVVVHQGVEGERVGAAVVHRSPRGTAVEVLDAQAVPPEWLSVLVKACRDSPSAGGARVHRDTAGEFEEILRRADERIGHDVTEVIDLIPAQVVVRRDLREKIACEKCEGELARAPQGDKVVTGGRLGSTLVAELLVDKYWDGLPLHRQKQRFERMGLTIPRAGRDSRYNHLFARVQRWRSPGPCSLPLPPSNRQPHESSHASPRWLSSHPAAP